MKKTIFLLMMASLFMYACNTTKSLETEVTMSIDSDFDVTIENKGKSDFSGKYTKQEYKDAYMTALKSSLVLYKIKVVPPSMSPDFTMKITKLSIVESTRLDTVKHAESPDNGKVFELTTGLLKANGTVIRVSTGKKYGWSANKSKSEKKTSFQSAGEMVSGQNKDLTKYREKQFDQYTFRNLASTCGSNSGVSVTREVKRLMK